MCMLKCCMTQSVKLLKSRHGCIMLLIGIWAGAGGVAMLYEPTKGFEVVIWGAGPLPEDDELEVGLIILFKFCPGITLGVALLGVGTDEGITGGGIAGGFGKIFGMLTGGISGFCGAGMIIIGNGGGGGTLGGGGGVGI